MTKLTKQDRREAEAILAEIRRRPAYRLALAWLARVKRTYPAHIGRPDEWHHGWESVGWLQNALKRYLAIHIEEDTLAVALECSGFKLRNSRRGWPECNLTELVVLDCLGPTPPWKTGFGDFADPTPDAQMSLH